ncbi:MAG: hypothetical protein NTW21_09495 [Verrucomicrobia bacterium]|nr:hypothetical protein [Verrucomicrobiota bacterium]
MPIDASEDIARAVCSDKFDPVTGEISPGFFKGANTSVSSLAVCPLEDSWDLFPKRVGKPPERVLHCIGVINVGRLAKIGLGITDKPTVLTVDDAPLEGYPSHAVIPQNITRGLSNEIVKNLTMEKPPWFGASFDAVMRGVKSRRA